MKRKRNLLSESHLLSDEGFKKIHRTFPFQVSGGVDGQEVCVSNVCFAISTCLCMNLLRVCRPKR